jgi:hypothetical protein
VSKVDHMLEPEVTAVQRPEVISGTGRRRQFASEFKARIVEGTLIPRGVISNVARRQASRHSRYSPGGAELASHRRVPRAKCRSLYRPL